MSKPVIKKRTAQICVPISGNAVELLQGMDAAVWAAIIERAEHSARSAIAREHGSIAVVDIAFSARFCTESGGEMRSSDFRQFTQASGTAKLLTADAPGDRGRFPTHLVFEFSLQFVRSKDEAKLKRHMAKSCRAAGLRTAGEWLVIIQKSVIAPGARVSQADVVEDLLKCQPDTFIGAEADKALRILYGEPGGSMPTGTVPKGQGRTTSPSVN